MTTIKICDAMMGTGKTTAAINYMNEHTGERYLYITPLLNEDDRIAKACPTLKFAKPESSAFKRRNKLEHLHQLLKDGRNIVSTHALFEKYNETTLNLIKEAGYILILDEVIDVVTVASAIHPLEKKHLFDDGILELGEDGYVVVHDELINKSHSSWNRVQSFKNKTVVFDEDFYFIYELPIDRFDVFKEVYLLTYMFDCQIQKYYYDMFGYGYEKIWIDKDMRFTSDKAKAKIILPDKNLFNIVEDKMLNAIGYSKTKSKKPLSYTSDISAEELKFNLKKLYLTRWGKPKGKFLWSTYKKHKDSVIFKEIEDSFLACNARGTNEYINRNYLAYCVDKYPNPMLVIYFKKKGITFDRDGYALSQMVQWIYRSAVRNGESIFVYIPSKRMRELLYGWLNTDKTPEITSDSFSKTIETYVGEHIPVKSQKAKDLQMVVSTYANETLSVEEACVWIEAHYPYTYVKDRPRIDGVRYTCIKLIAI